MTFSARESYLREVPNTYVYHILLTMLLEGGYPVVGNFSDGNTGQLWVFFEEVKEYIFFVRLRICPLTGVVPDLSNVTKADEDTRSLWAEMEARKEDAPLAFCGETLDERYSRNIGDRLWGQSCRQQPVNISSLEMAMANPTTGNIGGIVETAARFRDTLGKNLFIEDKGETRIRVCSCCLICSCVLVRV